jgi:hypothetical protein
MKDENDPIKVITLQDFKKIKCTYLRFGNVKLEQEAYYCDSCDINKEYPICKTCFENCHQNCKQLIQRDETIKQSLFVCYCGKAKKHIVTLSLEKTSNCNIYHIDSELELSSGYECKDCSKQLCSICYYECHSHCRRKNVVRISPTTSCDCNHENHSDNAFLFKLSKYLNNGPSVKHIQLINKFAEFGKPFEQLNQSVKRFLASEATTKKESLKLIKLLAEHTFGPSYRKIYFYNSKLSSVFPYEQLVEKIFSINKSSKSKYHESHIIPLIFYLHLKKDFQYTRKFSTLDYINTTIAQRLLLRSFLFSGIKKNFQEKYKIYTEQRRKGSLVDLALKIGELLGHEVFSDIYMIHICLRFIYFTLKRMMYNKNDLIKLIGVFAKTFDYLFTKILNFDDYIKDPDKTIHEDKIVLISYIIKILYLITVNYNDLTCFEIVKGERGSKHEFIHIHNEHSGQLFEMVLGYCVLFSKNFDLEESIFSKKLIILFNELINIFTITNNKYFKKIVSLNKMNVDFMYLLNPVIPPQKIDDLIIDLKVKVIQDMEDYYTLNKKIDSLNICTYFDELNAEIIKLFKFEKPEINKKPFAHKKYSHKVISFSTQTFSFLDEVGAHNIPLITESMKGANIDEILTRYIDIICDKKEDNSQEVRYIVSFLALFCISQDGINYLVIAKSINRIIKSFDKNYDLILIFLHLFFKGIKLHKVDLYGHASIDKITYNFFQYIKVDLSLTKHRKEQLILIMKIFTLMSKFYDYEVFKKIKAELLLYAKEIGVLEPELFRTSFDDCKAMSISDLSEKIENEFNALSFAITKFTISKKGPRSEEMRFIRLSEEDEDEEVDKLTLNNLETFSIRDNYTNNNELATNRQLYLTLIKFVCKNTYYMFEKEKFRDIIELLYQLTDLDYVIQLLDKKHLTIKQRGIFIKFVRTLYLMHIVNEEQLKSDSNIMTSVEYKEYNDLIDGGKDVPQVLRLKYEAITNMEKLIYLFISELQKLQYFTYLNYKNIKEVKRYLERVLLSVKFVADIFFLQKSLSNHMTFFLYELTVEFLKKSYIINKYLSIVSHGGVDLKMEIINLFKTKVDDNITLKEIQSIEYNYFNTADVYSKLLNEINIIFNATGLNRSFKIGRLLRDYDRMNNLNFFCHGLIFRGEFYKFYQDMDNQDTYANETIERLVELYKLQFYGINNTTFKQVIDNISTQSGETFLNLVVKYFITYFSSSKYIDEEYDISMLYLVTKLLHYNTKNTQTAMLGAITDDSFYYNFNTKFKKILALCSETGKHFFMFNRFSKYINLKTKLMSQLLQLLGEAFCKEFHNKIFETIMIDSSEMNEVDEIIFNTGEYNFEYFSRHNSKLLMIKKSQVGALTSLKSKTFIEIRFYDSMFNQLPFVLEELNITSSLAGELPNDNLIIMISNIINFLIEYNDNCMEMNDESLILSYKEKLIPMVKKVMFSHHIGLSDYRKKILLSVQLLFVKLLISYMQTGNSSKGYITKLNKEVAIIPLFEKAICYLNDLIEEMKKDKLIDQYISLESSGVIDILHSLYTNNENFEQSLQLKFCLNLFKYIKSISELHNIGVLEKIYSDENVEEISTIKGSMAANSSAGVNTYFFLNKIVAKVEVVNGDICNYIYFIKPPYSFLLSEDSKSKFHLQVDRSTRFSKLTSMLNESDYFIYEMLYNYYLQKSNIAKISRKFSFKYLEIVNYILICIQQILLLVHFYKDGESSDTQSSKFTKEERLTPYLGNQILAVIQIAYALLVLLIWIHYYFPLYLYKNYHPVLFKTKHFIMKEHEKSDLVLRFQGNFAGQNKALFDLWKYFRNFILFSFRYFMDLVSMKDTFIYSLTLIFTTCYIGFGQAILLVIPSLFIVNLFPLLETIVDSVKLRWKQLALVLLFTYIVIYLFSWIGFLYIDQLFIYDVYNPQTVIKN